VTYNAALLRALASGRAVSGAALGRELGVSRAAVWKAVRRLVDLGLDIEALPGRGYRLARPLTLLDRDGVQAALPAGIAARLGVLEVLAETDSTNARVLAAERPVGELVACLAEYQSAGRGRRGRQWLSPPGAGICLSVGGRVPAAPSDYAALPTAVGVACAAALEALGVRGIGLKWPNDLLLDGGKLGGILIELRGESQGPATVAVGLGLNIVARRRGHAGSIASTAGDCPRRTSRTWPGTRHRSAIRARGGAARSDRRLPGARARGAERCGAVADGGSEIACGTGGTHRGCRRRACRHSTRHSTASGALLLETAEGVCGSASRPVRSR
jgi:BirA family transcriptional regulator, biotin operon repressor / biotin---[acetyl-CoA-carboxylase] ligase